MTALEPATTLNKMMNTLLSLPMVRKHHWKGYLSTVMEGMEYHTGDILEAL